MREVLQLLLFFYIYSFLGWCSEVIFVTTQTKTFVNRGFLNGPVCPIYGFGAVGVILALSPLKNRPILLFIASALLASAVELVAGYLLERIFNLKWWDYSSENFNVGGYICLRFSLLWGIAGMVLISSLHPPIQAFANHMSTHLLAILTGIFSAIFIADLIATIIALRNIKIGVKIIHSTAADMHRLADQIGSKLSEKTLSAMEKGEKSKEQWEVAKEKLENHPSVKELREKLDTMYLEGHLGAKELRDKLDNLRDKYQNQAENLAKRRIFKAFPRLKDMIDEQDDTISFQ